MQTGYLTAAGLSYKIVNQNEKKDQEGFYEGSNRFKEKSLWRSNRDRMGVRIGTKVEKCRKEGLMKVKRLLFAIVLVFANCFFGYRTGN